MTAIRNVTRIKQPVGKQGIGLRILLGSLIAGAAGVAPLLLYTLLGPADGNPMGLGLLAMLAMAIAIIGALIGAVTVAVEHIKQTRS
jgi:hypothetical protein